jgi:hypothetical protein
MYAELEVSRSGCYAWRLSGPSARARPDDTFTVMIDETFTLMIKAICPQVAGTSACGRSGAGLAALGHLLPPKLGWRLTRAAGLHGPHARAKAWKRTNVHGEKTEEPVTDALGNPRERTETVLAGAVRAA